jgi:hypothetical protein
VHESASGPSRQAAFFGPTVANGRHAKPIGGFEIDPKLEVRRLFDRDVELASISAMSWRRATAT